MTHENHFPKAYLLPALQAGLMVIPEDRQREPRHAKAKKSGAQAFDVYGGNEDGAFEEGWKNELIREDSLLVMGSLLQKFAGKIDLCLP